uniref:Uncharacterized protein n=1 Tax=Coralloluteibacterium stylophorae TaxID=1776034 RepID=A0A8J8AY99_9GAMM
MAADHVIDYIGGSDEDVAHLRLMLRKLRGRLRRTWEMGAEIHADLVLVDRASVAGEAAHQRTLERGVACAEIWREGDPLPADRYLPLPLREDDLVALLDGFDPGSIIAPVPLISHGADFFVMDIGDDAGLQVDPNLLSAVPDGDLGAGAWQRGAAAQDLDHDALFRRDPMADDVRMLVPDSLGNAALEEREGRPTARSRARSETRRETTFEAEEPGGAGIADPVAVPQALQGGGPWPLRDYLRHPILAAPARLELMGLPPLVLDPKQESYDSPAPLPELELYCLQSLKRSDWQPLSSAEIADLHAAGTLRPWRRLLWMDRLLTSDGRLEPQFDRAGTFWITRWLDIIHDYPHHARIASAMMQPRRLHEIAEAAKATMTEVFDSVNAFHAIGDLRWEAKPRGEPRSA